MCSFTVLCGSFFNYLFCNDMRNWIFWIVVVFGLCTLPIGVHAQSRFTISGYVEDAESGEKLIGATIYAPELKAGTVANKYGFYSLTLPASEVVKIVVSFVGYKVQILHISNRKDVVMNIRLTPEPTSNETEIVGERVENIIQSTRMGTIDVPIEQIRKVPAILGERDLLKAIQLLPGVKGGTEGSSGLYVRGGGPDQNLILLDGAPVYNASHLFGFFSVFNTDAIQHVELTKGGFPARYGGRLSSVLDISMKEGNLREWQADGGVGIISSRLTVQGPLIKDKMSVLVSGRRTYADVLARPIIRSLNARGEGPGGEVGYYFYDLNAKLNYIISPKDRVYLSTYSGKDHAYTNIIQNNELDNLALGLSISTSESTKGDLKWGNQTTTFRWNHLFSKQLFANTMMTYSDYTFNIDLGYEYKRSENGKLIERDYQRAQYLSGITDKSARIDFDYLPIPAHAIKFGALGIWHAYRPGAASLRTEETGVAPRDTTLAPKTTLTKATELAAYIEDDWAISEKMKFNVGLHASGFQVGKTFYPSLQPRFAFRYLTGAYAFKASFVTMRQYVHLLANSGVGLPTDLWLPATERVKPQSAWQAALGISRVFSEAGIEASIEGYYKPMKNLIEYKVGANFLNDPTTDWQDKVEIGNGEAYGLEFFLQKKTGRTSGWIGYTLSWSNRTFPNLNNGLTFPYRYDRRHDLAVVVSHKISEKADFAFNWVYGSGNAVTLAQARFRGMDQLPGDPIGLVGGGFRGQLHDPRMVLTDYGSRNGYRTTAMHRLDVALNIHRNKSMAFLGNRIRTWTFGAYNAYNHKNPFYIYLSTRYEFPDGFFGEPKMTTQYRQVSIVPVIPSISYTFKI